MKKQRYVLTIQNSNILKEVDVSTETPFIKIGTMQDCDIRLKRELFDVPIFIGLSFSDDEWHVMCCEQLIFKSTNESEFAETVINHGDVLFVYERESKKPVLSLTFAYDFNVSGADYDTMIDIRQCRNLIIGNAQNANIRLSGEYIGSEYIVLQRGDDGKITLDVTNADNSATLNGIRLFRNKVIEEFDFIGIADYSFYYKNGILYTVARSDMQVTGVAVQPLRDETPAFNYPNINRSPRMMFKFDDSPIEILVPPTKPAKPKTNIVLQLMPALAMMAVTVITRSGIIPGLNTGNASFLIFSISTMSVGIMTTIISFIHNRKTYKRDIAEWKSDYFSYIERKKGEIELEREDERNALLDIYPSLESLRDYVKKFSGRLFERSPEDPDFLDIRVGLGEVPAKRKVSVSRSEEHVKVENELAMIPEQICEQYKMLKKSPILIHPKASGSIGVVGSKEDSYDFCKSVLFDLCTMHSYEDLQVVILIPGSEKKRFLWAKWLPHINNMSNGMRGIVCDDESRDNVFEYLYALMTQRSALKSQNAEYDPLPYYVVFVLEEWGLKTHPLYQYAKNSSELGLSFISFKEYKENLPIECKEIVELTSDGGTYRVKNDKMLSVRFEREHIKDDSIRFSAVRLAPVYSEKIALASRLTSNITLFDLLNIISPEDLNLNDRWSKANSGKTLAVPLGVDVKGNIVSLDLHEKAHGPHGLVAGTTGSGKSEIMQSYILSAAVNYHPYELSFVIIDFKGGGMANQFENLPHLIGKITDIDSHEINRSLLSIRAELEKRKRLFAQYGVNHIDQYIAKFRSGAVKTALPHLVLIVDEFAELKAEQPEFMKELISTARIGRSLGIHLILATQKPSGQVNEQIWSNSRFKLCLKVATKEDSTEVLKSPLAFEIREPGRAYFQVGNNEIFTLFQSAYSGASAISDKNGNTNEFSISEVSFTGKRTVVYENKVERDSNGAQLTQLKAIVDYVDKYCKDYGIDRLDSICMPPLPEVIDYTSAEMPGSTRRFCVNIGIYDDPSNQVQPPVELDLTNGNIALIGAAQTGKTMLLQTIIRGIAEQYTSKQVSVYILDFASKVLKIFENLNHVGGVVTDSEDERLKNFFKMMEEEIDNRKNLFSKQGISSYETYLQNDEGPELPLIVIMVDNLILFKELFPEYEDMMLNICREGLSLGITVIMTAKQTTGVSYRYLTNFAQRIAFNCTESSEYNTIFDRCRIAPKNLQGRGLISIDKNIYEFHAYLPFDGIVDTIGTETVRSESKRIAQAKDFMRSVNAKNSSKARTIPSIPALLTKSYFEENRISTDDYVVPIGLTYSEIEPVTIDLAHIGSVGIYGRSKFGKSNLLRTIMSYLQENVFDFACSAYLIDGFDRQLTEYNDFGIVENLTLDCGDFEDIVQTFRDAANERIEILKSGGNLNDLPLMLCVIQNQQIFAMGTVSKTASEMVKGLLEEAKQLKMCFIFSNIENNGEYSVSEMMKLVKGLSQYIHLDDLQNIKFFGQGKFTQAERKFKKQLAVGDGYVCDSNGNIEKIKLVKTNSKGEL